MTLIEELKRRRVFRVAGLYLVVSWIVAEVADVVFPPLQLPDWTITFVIMLLILGFPLAMLLAWIFDIGPEGIERTPATEQVREKIRHPRALLLYGGLLAGATLILALVLMAPWRAWLGFEAPGRSSIAVLPFANMSGDPSNDYFSDGMSEELLNLLAKVPDLKVAARTSAFAFKGQSVDVREVGQKLGVETVLEGSVRWAGDRVRITAQLVDTETGYHLWSDTYDEELENIFEVQGRISREIVEALRGSLVVSTNGEAALASVQAPTRDVTAYDLYLKGRELLRKRGEPNIRLAMDLFQGAVGRDPGFGRAWASLAQAYVILPVYADVDDQETYEFAGDSAVKALTLDATLAEAHAVLARINAVNWNWTDAETGFFAAIGLHPGEPTPHHWYSHLLRETGRLQDALVQILEARELDPESPVINGALATVYMAMADNDQGMASTAKARELGFAQSLYSLDGIMHLRGGDAGQAIAALREGGGWLDLPQDLVEPFVTAVLEPGTRPAFLEMLDATDEEALGALHRFLVLLLLDDVESAYGLLEAGPEHLSFPLLWLWIPEAAGFRQDPRFPELMRGMGFHEYWKQYGWSDACQPDGQDFTCR